MPGEDLRAALMCAPRRIVSTVYSYIGSFRAQYSNSPSSVSGWPPMSCLCHSRASESRESPPSTVNCPAPVRSASCGKAPKIQRQAAATHRPQCQPRFRPCSLTPDAFVMRTMWMLTATTTEMELLWVMIIFGKCAKFFAKPPKMQNSSL